VNPKVHQTIHGPSAVCHHQPTPARRRLAVQAVTLLLGLLGVPFFAAAGTTLEITPATPLFAAPSIAAKVIRVVDSDTTLDVLETRNVFVEENPAVRLQREWHPLLMAAQFHRVRLDPTTEAWVSQDFRYDTETRLVVPVCYPYARFMFLYALACIGFAGLLLYGARRGHLREVFRGGHELIFTRATGVWCVVLIVTLRLLLLAWVRLNAGNLFPRPVDELGYFNVGAGILSGRFGEPWNFTIGLPILYIPVMAALRISNHDDMAVCFSFVNSVVFFPAALVLVFWVVQRLAKASRPALVVALLWAVLPFFYFPVEFHSTSPTVEPLFKSVFATPDFDSASYRLYYIFTAVGLNGMSEAASALFILLTVYLALSLEPGTRQVLIVGGLFGFACMIRINNIFFAPLLAYLFWVGNKAAGAGLGDNLRRALMAVVAFIVVFSPQFVLNQVQFGNPLTFPYVLHSTGAARGFELSCLPRGIPLIVGCNYVLMSAAAVGLLFFRSRFLRNTLGLWAIPLVVFFAGYAVAGASPIRFILTAHPALIAAFVCTDVWTEADWKCRLAAAAIVTANFVLVSPVARFTPSFPFALEQWAGGIMVARHLAIWVPLLSVGVAVFVLRGAPRLLVFVIAILTLFNAGSPQFVFALLLGVLGWIGFDWARDGAVTLRTPPCRPSGSEPQTSGCAGGG